MITHIYTATFQRAADATRATRAVPFCLPRLPRAERVAHRYDDNVLSTRERVRIEQAAPTDGVTNLGQPREPDVTSRLARASQARYATAARVYRKIRAIERPPTHVARDRFVSRRRETTNSWTESMDSRAREIRSFSLARCGRVAETRPDSPRSDAKC